MYKPQELPFVDDSEAGSQISTEGLAYYIQRELEEISKSFLSTSYITLETHNVEPEKLYDGLTVLADGTNWDPGSGQGVYTYYGSAWNKLG